MLLVEVSLALLALFRGFTFPETPLFEHVELALTWLSLRRRLEVIVVGLSALGLRLSLLPVLHTPNPASEGRFLVMVCHDFPCP
jgi:hypothetical protein